VVEMAERLNASDHRSLIVILLETAMQAKKPRMACQSSREVAGRALEGFSRSPAGLSERPRGRV
jgi:hypothetical protein